MSNKCMNKKDSLITEPIQKEIPFIVEEDEEEFEQIETTNTSSQPLWYKEWLIKKALWVNIE